jgi:hypothetical protein
MTDHIETPDTDDVEGHVLGLDEDGRAGAPTRRIMSLDEGDDVEGHVLDLDVERKR